MDTYFSNETSAFSNMSTIVAPLAADNESEVLRNFTVEEVMKVHFYYGLLIDRAITPFWYIIGLVGNTISAIVWLKPRMRKNSSSAIYLSALSINDNLCLLLHLPQELHYAWYLGVLDVPVVCQLYGVWYLAVQYLSPFLVLSFTFDRFIAICYPFKKYRFCTTSTAVKMVALNVLVGLAFSSVQGYLWTYNTKSGLCEVREELMDESNGTSLWLKWTTISESIIFLFIPSLNTFLNILVIHEIWKISGRPTASVNASKPSLSSQALQGSHHNTQPSLSRLSLALSAANCRRKTNQNQPAVNQNGLAHRQQQQQHQHLLVRPSGSGGNRGTGSSNAPRSHGNGSGSGGYTSSCNSNSACVSSGSAAATNVMLLSVSFYVIFTTLPPAIIYSVENRFPYGELTNTSHQQIRNDPTWQRLITYMYVRTIVYEFSLSHFACNFFLFAFTGRKFRHAFTFYFSENNDRAALSSIFRCRLWRTEMDDASSCHGDRGGGGGGGGGGGWFLGPQEHSSTQQHHLQPPQQQQQHHQQQQTLMSSLRSKASDKDLRLTSNSCV